MTVVNLLERSILIIISIIMIAFISINIIIFVFLPVIGVLFVVFFQITILRI